MKLRYLATWLVAVLVFFGGVLRARRFVFAPWKAGSYQVVIDAELEDLAGNKMGVPFDVDTFQPVAKRITTATVSLDFNSA